MADKRYTIGIDPGHGVEQTAGVVIRVEDGQPIGVLRSFKVREKKGTQPCFKLKESIYRIPESTVYEIPISAMWINEEWLRTALLDAEYDDAPPREVYP